MNHHFIAEVLHMLRKVEELEHVASLMFSENPVKTILMAWCKGKLQVFVFRKFISAYSAEIFLKE